MQPRLFSPAIEDGPPLLGLAFLAKRTFLGIDQQPILDQLTARLAHNPHDAHALLDLSILLHLLGQSETALALQAEALALQQCFHLNSAVSPASTRLLTFMTAGDLTQNNAIEFLVANNDVALEILFLAPNLPLPRELPEHDAAIVAICESDRNRPLLAQLERPLRHWPRPVLNLPKHIARLTRDGACDLVPDFPGVHLPLTVRTNKSTLFGLATETVELEEILPGGQFPLIVRPVDTHKGQGQAKLDTPRATLDYLRARTEEEFYVTRFIDYRSRDSQFRKYRIILIAGQPFLCHLAISDHWMVHYMSAGMTQSPVKRAEEAAAMANFDQDFAHRHGAALAHFAKQLELDYVGLDCGETESGELLIFEFDSGMTIHSMDPPEMFPYKGPQMAKVFAAFRDLVLSARNRARATRPAA